MNTVLAIVMAVVVAFLISSLLGIGLVPWLHKMKFGQTIYSGLDAEQRKKQGTPTMGGVMFIAGTVISFGVVILTDYLCGGDIIAGDSPVGNINKTKLYAGLIMAFAMSLIGFFDDYLKIKRKENEGLTEIQKTIAEILVAICYMLSLSSSDDVFLYIPFAGSFTYVSPVLFWLLGFLVIYGTVNAVNFTDGVDGLCSSVTITAALSFAVMAAIRNYLGVSVLASALIGALAGFLIWNHHPARCFMGDTGALFLGGMIVALAFAIDCPLIIVFAGIIYFIEAVSVLLQRTYFKLTHGKRLPYVSPIHHDCEKKGWSENKIVIVFTLINLTGGVLSVLLFWFGK